MGDVNKLLDASITGVGMPTKPAPVMDLSKIDFEALRSRFKEVQAQEHRPRSPQSRHPRPTGKADSPEQTRTDFAEKFEQLIDPTTPAVRTSRNCSRSC